MSISRADAIRAAEQIVGAIAERHQDTLKDRVDALALAVVRGDDDQATLIAHTIAGEAECLGWPAVGEVARGMRQSLETPPSQKRLELLSAGVTVLNALMVPEMKDDQEAAMMLLEEFKRAAQHIEGISKPDMSHDAVEKGRPR